MFLLLNKIKLDQEEVYNKLRSIRSEKTKISIIHYLKKIYYLKTILRNALKNISNNNLSTNKNSKGKIDLVIVFIVIILTTLWFVDSQIPTGILELEYFGVKITSNGFKDVNIFIWFVSRKLIVIIFLSLWFITCQHWWKFAIFLSDFLVLLVAEERKLQAE